MTSGEIGGLAAKIGVPVLCLVLAWLRPYRSQQFSQVPFAELQRRYGAWQASTAIPIAVFTVLLVYYWYGLFKFLHTLAVNRLPPTQFLLVPDHMYWFLLAFLLGMISAVLPVHSIYSFLLGDRYGEFTHYGNLAVGFDAWWLIRRLSIGILLVVGIGTIAGLDCYTAFTNDRLVNNPFLSFGEEDHRYCDIKEIRSIRTFRAPSGDRVVRPYFQIAFTDGSTWSSKDGLHEPNPATDRAILAFLSQRCGRPVTDYEIAPD